MEFTDGGRVELGTNIIAECMYAQCDVKGKQFRLMEAIMDHKMTDDAVQKEDMYFMLRGRQHMKHTTKGWMLCVQWKDKSTSWEKLSDMKESYPIEVAEYATALCIQDEPAFAWWAKAVLWKRQWIIAAVNRQYHKMTHKFGIHVLKTVKEALDLDKENRNSLWWDEIMKEMKSIRVAFRILSEDEKPAIGSQFMQCHMIFDIKMEDFMRKARLVTGGHMTEAPKTLTYASVISRETVRITLTIAALNDLEVKTAGVQNAFLTAPCSESIHMTLGPEFGEDQGKTAVIVCTLYGLTSAEASFRNHLAECMCHLGYHSCLADPDLWYKPMVCPEDNFKYYSYALLYVDDCPCICHNAEQELHKIVKFFKKKDGLVGNPDIYLGAKVKKMELPNGVKAWALSSSKYIQEAMQNCKKYLAYSMNGRKLT